MGTPNIAFNPYATTNAAGSFNITSTGYVQGLFLDDPALRNELAGGTYIGTSTPLWGGCAITEGIRDGSAGAGTNPGYLSSLGTLINLATTVTAASGANAALGQVTGFSVFNQMNHGITTPQSPVPTFGTNASVGFLRLGSGMRLPVAMDPSLVDATGSLITSYFSWNFDGQYLQPYDAATGTVAISGMTYATTNGGQIAITTSAATLVGGIGDIVNISGATTTGTGGNAAVNGNFVVNTFTSNEAFTVAATNPGGAAYYGTITVSSAVVNEGVGILPVKVLEVQIGNSMTVEWDPVNQVATWNRQGSTAIILL